MSDASAMDFANNPGSIAVLSASLARALSLTELFVQFIRLSEKIRRD